MNTKTQTLLKTYWNHMNEMLGESGGSKRQNTTSDDESVQGATSTPTNRRKKPRLSTSRIIPSPETFFRYQQSKLRAKQKQEKYEATVHERLQAVLNIKLTAVLTDFREWGNEALADLVPVNHPILFQEYNVEILNRLEAQVLEALLNEASWRLNGEDISSHLPSTSKKGSALEE